MWYLQYSKSSCYFQSSHLMQVLLWAPASPSALHPRGCNSSASALWGQKCRRIVKSSTLSLTFLPIMYPSRRWQCRQKQSFKIKEHKRLSANPSQLHISCTYNVPLYFYEHVWLTCSTCPLGQICREQQTAEERTASVLNYVVFHHISTQRNALQITHL